MSDLEPETQRQVIGFLAGLVRGESYAAVELFLGSLRQDRPVTGTWLPMEPASSR